MQTFGFVKADDSVLKQRKYVARTVVAFQKAAARTSFLPVTRSWWLDQPWHYAE